MLEGTKLAPSVLEHVLILGIQLSSHSPYTLLYMLPPRTIFFWYSEYNNDVYVYLKCYTSKYLRNYYSTVTYY